MPKTTQDARPTDQPIPQPSANKRGGGARLVYQTIRNEIFELKLAPGIPLDETSLAHRFSLSRSPIREALVRLSAEGLVQTLSNRSTIVTPLNLVEFPRYVEALDYLQRIVTRLAARNRTEQDLHDLKAAAEFYDAKCLEGNHLLMSQANKDFHMTIAKAGRNPYFSDHYRKLLNEGRRILHMHYQRRRDLKEKFPLGAEHFQIIKAIEARDELRADQLAHEHTRMFHERLVEFMGVNFLEELEPSEQLS